MASTDLTPTEEPNAAAVGESSNLDLGEALIRRPAELVELVEQVYRGFFGAGLLVASIATGYATLLGTLQPPDGRIAGITACVLLLVGQVVALAQRRRLYRILRRRPSLLVVPALAIGAGAWATGAHNEQLFYVLAILLAVLGAAVPLLIVAWASLVAAAGMAIPHITDGSWSIGVAVAAGLLPPLFWLILEQLARYVLRLHQAHDPPRPRRSTRVRVWIDREPSADEPRQSDPAPGFERAAPTRETTLERQRVDLTARQLEVLLLCAEGLKHEEIGACLEVGPVQVGRHLGNARKKAAVATNAELVAWAIDSNLIPFNTCDP